MAKRLQLRRGNTAQTNAFTGALGEVTVDTDKDVPVVHDGTTVGGFPVAARANADGTITLVNKAGTVLATIPSTGLFVNNLTSTATNQALTAAQGKVLQDNKLDKTANAVSASKLATARTIAISGAVTGTATSFDGSANISIATTAIDGSNISTGTIPAARIPTLNQSTTGNAATATALATARTINGVSFNGTANITVADGTKVPLAGGTMTGALRVNNTTASTSVTTGAITTTGGVGIGGALFTTGAITSANNVTAYSDIRIKDNITVIDDALNKVNQLKGVTFNRTDTDDKDKRYVGLIAQDVQSVMPEAVNVNDDEINTLSVDYQGLIGLLVEAIKELESKVAALEDK